MRRTRQRVERFADSAIGFLVSFSFVLFPRLIVFTGGPEAGC